MADRGRATIPEVSCLFCGALDKSREHAFPRWLQKWANPRNLKFNQLVPDGRIVRKNGWNAALAGHVCDACDKWSGQVFENRIAPRFKAINGHPQSYHHLPLDAQRLFASWAFKTTLMLECVRDDPKLSASTCREFRQTGEPPTSCLVAIGMTYRPHLRYFRSVVSMSRFLGPDAPTAYFRLLLVGYMVFHIIDGLDIAIWEADAVRRIWPPTYARVDWPLPEVLTSEALQTIANQGGGNFAIDEIL